MSNVSILKAVSSFLSYNADGSIDIDGTMLQIQDNLQTELAQVAERDKVFQNHLNAIFDNSNGDEGLPTKWVAGKVAQIVACGDEVMERELIAEVEDFIARSPKFEARRGRKGGLFRVG